MQVNKILNHCNICVTLQSVRKLSCSSVDYGMRNFNKFVLIRRGTEREKKKQAENPDPELVYTSKSILKIIHPLSS